MADMELDSLFDVYFGMTGWGWDLPGLKALFHLSDQYLSIIPAISVCVSVYMCVCLRLPFLDDRWSDLIETCQEYCRGRADVPFQGLIWIGRVVPRLRTFICQPMTGHGAMSRMTSQLMFIYLFIYFARLTSQFFFFFVWYDITIDAGDLSMCLFKVWYRSSSISAVSQVFPKVWKLFFPKVWINCSNY